MKSLYKYIFDESLLDDEEDLMSAIDNVNIPNLLKLKIVNFYFSSTKPNIKPLWSAFHWNKVNKIANNISQYYKYLSLANTILQEEDKVAKLVSIICSNVYCHKNDSWRSVKDILYDTFNKLFKNSYIIGPGYYVFEYKESMGKSYIRLIIPQDSKNKQTIMTTNEIGIELEFEGKLFNS